MTLRKVCLCLGLWLCAWLGLTSAVQAAEPGTEFPPSAEASTQKMGSVLIYPFFAASASASATQETRISITNHHDTLEAFVSLYFVSNTGGSVDSSICLLPKQTANFLASDVFLGTPGFTQGFLIVVAVNNQGFPLNFNALTGDALIKLPDGLQASLKAVAVAAINLPAFSGQTATLNFDGAAYNRLPRTLAADQLKSTLDGNNTFLAVARIGGNLAAGNGAALGPLSGSLYNAAGTAFPFTASSSGPQLFNQLSSSFPSVTPNFSQIIPAGSAGWLHIAADGDFGIVGAVLNFNAATVTQPRAHTGGHWLRPLTLTSAASLTIGVFTPGCLGRPRS
jgi:hypothetical protein